MADLSWLKGLQEVNGFNKLGVSKDNLIGRAKEWLLEPKNEELKDLHLHIYGTETMSLTADITDNFVESNIAYQDHIALKPKVFTLSGEVGELTWFRNDMSESVTLAVEQKLQPVVAFLPPISKQASSLQDKALKIMGIVDSIDNFANRIWSMLSKDDVDTEQKKEYKYLMTLWMNREPIDIRTPFGKIHNYVIQNIEFTQPDRTKDKSQIKISFKEFRVVKEKVRSFDSKKYMARKAAQMGQKQSKGTTTGIKLEPLDCKCKAWCPIENESAGKNVTNVFRRGG